MKLGIVVGNIVSSQKVEQLVGHKLLIVRELTIDKEPTDTFVISIDTVGAGEGEIVMTVSGSSARQCAKTKNVPTDSSIVAIVDKVDINKELVN
jgi:microcompartment protein CcmK/EutM